MILNGCLFEFDFAYLNQKTFSIVFGVYCRNRPQQLRFDHSLAILIIPNNDCFRYGCALLSVIDQRITNGSKCSLESPSYAKSSILSMIYFSMSIYSNSFLWCVVSIFSPNLNDINITIIYEDWCVLMVFGVSLITFVHFASTVNHFRLLLQYWASWEG